MSLSLHRQRVFFILRWAGQYDQADSPVCSGCLWIRRSRVDVLRAGRRCWSCSVPTRRRQLLLVCCLAAISAWVCACVRVQSLPSLECSCVFAERVRQRCAAVIVHANVARVHISACANQFPYQSGCFDRFCISRDGGYLALFNPATQTSFSSSVRVWRW